MSRHNRVLALLLCLLLPLGALANEQTPSIPEGYKAIANSEGWILYLKEDNLGLIMQDTSTGQLMLSTVENPQDYRDNDLWKGFYQSGIVLEYIEGTINKYPWANLVTTSHTKDFTYVDDGFDCRVHYTDLGISYLVSVRLSGGDLMIHIPQSEIKEENPLYTVGSFYVYPFMGYTYMGESGGYMLIPDGQGALIDLKDNEGRYASPYKATVYGNNIGLTELAQGSTLNNFSTNIPPERAAMPVFGMYHKDTGISYVSILEEGDSSATIQATMNGVSNMGFDFISAMYTYRVVYAQSTGPASGTLNMRTPRPKQFDIRQRFRFLQGEQSGYAGMAVAYRDYLQQKGVFGEVPKNSPFGIQVDFLGAERKNGLVGTQAVVMTTAEQATDILNRLHENGVRDTFSVFKGWQAQGWYGARPLTSYAPAGFLGGKGGFGSLYDRAEALGYTLALEADVSSLNPTTAGSLVYSAMKKVDSNTFSRNIFGRVYPSMQVLNPLKSLELAQSLSQEMRDNKVPGVSLTGLTQVVSDYTFRQVYYDSRQSMETFDQAAQAFSDKLPAALQYANAYLWAQASALTNMPSAGSDYTYVSRDVPFMAIALSGKMPLYAEYVNFQANTRQFFLRLVEQGARPAFLLTWEDPILLQDTNANDIYSSRFELYEEMMVDWYKELAQVHEKTQDASILDHKILGELSRVDYSNGVTVLVNQGFEAVAYKGIEVSAQSYKVVNTSDVR